MTAHKQLIEDFYNAFNRLDGKTMGECYHDEVVFYDPVFENLDARHAKAMWKMLTSTAKDFSLTFSDVEASEEYGSCKWIATYTFSKTGRKVVNHVKAHFKFHEGKIVEHMDDFNLYKWSRQALGTPGLLLGWSSSMHKKIRKNAKDGLALYMKRHRL
ncbi:MAG: nuclear transport factor 2 family protein [Flavitalea sp.]